MVRHKLVVGGENWTDRLLSTSVQFRADAGSSGMDFSVTGSTEDYKDAPVSLWLGDGSDRQPYFKGTLQGPNDDEKLDISSAKAFSPFKNMADQVLGSNETFIGHTLEYVIMACARRTERRPGDIIVINGSQYHVQQGEQFPFDNKIADVLSSLMEKANFVAVDQPGGRREFMPRPRPGSNKDYARNYRLGSYIEFGLDPSNETNYRKVVVYRNGDNGKPVVYAEREVNPLAPKNRWFVVSDFAGSQKDAGDEAYRLALELRMGLNSFSMTIPFDRNLRVYDGFRLVKEKRGNRKTYACFIDDGFTVDYSPGNAAIMSVGGTAYEIKRDRQVVEVAEHRSVVSASVLSRHTSTDISSDSTLVTVDSGIEV